MNQRDQLAKKIEGLRVPPHAIEVPQAHAPRARRGARMSEGIVFAKNDPAQRARQRERLLRVVDEFLPPDQAWEVTFKRFHAERSEKQNKALWSVAYKTLSDATGHEPDELHVVFCGEYFGWVEYEVMGQRRKRPRRTTTTDENGKRKKLDTAEFAKFFDFIQRRAMEAAGIFIPDPDPNWRSAA